MKVRCISLLVAAYCLYVHAGVDTLRGSALQNSNMKPALRFQQNNTFKIVQIADVHYGENEEGPWGPEQDSNSTRAIKRILAYETPDFVVFSGDQVTGNNVHSNATAYWRQVVETAASTGYPFASIFGNHDDLADGDLGTRLDLMKADMSYPTSYSRAGPSGIHGVSNYHLEVFPPKGDGQGSETPFLVLYFMDSGGGQEQPGYVFKDQVDWFSQLSGRMKSKYRANIPGAVFVHIPLVEYNGLYDGKECVGMDENGGVTPFDKDEGLFQAFHETGDIRAVFVGHDHGNDWCCPYQGLELCFGRHTGYGGYGSWDRGARVVEMSYAESGKISFKTWVRMEDGQVVHETKF